MFNKILGDTPLNLARCCVELFSGHRVPLYASQFAFSFRNLSLGRTVMKGPYIPPREEVSTRHIVDLAALYKLTPG